MFDYLIVGAGFIGCHVVRDLIRAGFEVDVVTRSAPRPELASYLDGATVVLGDVSSMSTIAAARSRRTANTWLKYM